jgi:hypothetical protein
MRRQNRIIASGALFTAVVIMVVAGVTHSARSALQSSPYSNTIDRVMPQIVSGRIDDALAAIDFLKDQPDARATLRSRLVQISNVEQQKCYGYEIAAVQRFSDRLQSVLALVYYDQQPYLFRFELYHPQAKADDPWLIQGLSIHPNVLEELKDTPIEYTGGRVSAPR